MIKKALALIICTTISTVHAAEVKEENSSKEATIIQDIAYHTTIRLETAKLTSSDHNKISKATYDLIKPLIASEPQQSHTGYREGKLISTRDYPFAKDLCIQLHSDEIADENTPIKKVIVYVEGNKKDEISKETPTKCILFFITANDKYLFYPLKDEEFFSSKF